MIPKKISFIKKNMIPKKIYALLKNKHDFPEKISFIDLKKNITVLKHLHQNTPPHPTSKKHPRYTSSKAQLLNVVSPTLAAPYVTRVEAAAASPLGPKVVVVESSMARGQGMTTGWDGGGLVGEAKAGHLGVTLPQAVDTRA